MFLLLLLTVEFNYAQEKQVLYKAGSDGYACFRIPAIVCANSGVLLAFAEGRKKDCGDAGDIDLVLRRSFDHGKTWSPLQVIWSDSTHTCGNPAPVVDRRTGKISLLSTWNLGTDHEWQIINGKSQDTRRIFLLSSTDEGAHWTAPQEITNEVKLPNWTWYATGPCNGIQLQKGAHKGRLIIPCDHIEAVSKKYYSHAIYSDDGGSSWKLGGTTPLDQVNESTVAEIGKGRIMMNMRNYNATRIRQTSISKDGGESWETLQGDSGLVEPVCQASLVRNYGRGRNSYLAFSNPADSKLRVRMTVKISKDWGKTWFVEKVLHEGPSAYSNLVVLGNGGLGCFYEAGEKNAYEGLVFELVKAA